MAEPSRTTEHGPQRHPGLEFHLRELAGAMGDFGTLFPLAIGYVAGLALAYGVRCPASAPMQRRKA